MTLYKYFDDTPQTPKQSYWIAENATLIGKVIIGEEVGIWFGAVIRGDNEPVVIGKRTNIQENTIIHMDKDFPVIIGDGSTIGHKSMLHGCKIGNNTLIGMSSILLNGSKIGNNCIVGAGSLITEGKQFPDGTLILGVPARVKRDLTEQEIKNNKWSADHYVKNYKKLISNLTKI